MSSERQKIVGELRNGARNRHGKSLSYFIACIPVINDDRQ